MRHASKKYESSLRFNDDESICLVHFHLLQQSLFSSSLGLDEDEVARHSCPYILSVSGPTLWPRVGFLTARLAKIICGKPLKTCRTAYY